MSLAKDICKTFNFLHNIRLVNAKSVDCSPSNSKYSKVDPCNSQIALIVLFKMEKKYQFIKLIR